MDEKQTNDQTIASVRANAGTFTNKTSGAKTKTVKPRSVLNKIVKNDTGKDESHHSTQGTEIQREEDQNKSNFSKPQNNFGASLRVIEEKS